MTPSLERKHTFPPHLTNGTKVEERLAVFVYRDPPGWWERIAEFDDEMSAMVCARGHSFGGRREVAIAAFTRTTSPYRVLMSDV